MNLVFHIAPAGGIRWSCRSRFGIVYFNSRPRVGGVAESGATLQYLKYFNSRPRVGGVSVEWSRIWCAAYFNSRPRVGGVRNASLAMLPEDAISILAPAWGASSASSENSSANWLISILAPAWGASANTENRLKNLQFQFSPPRGGVIIRTGEVCGFLISILAPAWGAS